jgi:hypothetical protein
MSGLTLIQTGSNTASFLTSCFNLIKALTSLKDGTGSQEEVITASSSLASAAAAGQPYQSGFAQQFDLALGQLTVSAMWDFDSRLIIRSKVRNYVGRFRSLRKLGYAWTNTGRHFWTIWATLSVAELAI